MTSPLPLVVDRFPLTVDDPRFSTPLDARVRLPLAITVPRVSGPASLRLTCAPEALTAEPKVLFALVRPMSAGTPASLAWSAVVPPTASVAPADCVMVPPRAVTARFDVAASVPSVTAPAVLVRLTAPADILANDKLPCDWVIVTDPGPMLI